MGRQQLRHLPIYKSITFYYSEFRIVVFHFLFFFPPFSLQRSCVIGDGRRMETLDDDDDDDRVASASRFVVITSALVVVVVVDLVFFTRNDVVTDFHFVST